MTCVLMVIFTSCSLVTRQRPDQDLSVPASLPAIPRDDQQPPATLNGRHGAQIYEQKCAACHGTSGAGDGPSSAAIRAQGKQVANLIDPVTSREAKPVDWLRVIATGRISNLMPPFSGSLTSQDRWDVLTYIWSLQTNVKTVEATAPLFQSTCAGCHAKPGLLMSGAAPGKYSLSELAGALYRSPSHQGVVSITMMSDLQRLQMSEYVRSSTFDSVPAATLRETTQIGDGRLTYQLQNLNRPNITVVGGSVTLHGYDRTSEVYSRTVPITTTGAVAFEGVPRRADVFYEPEVIYSGGRFYGAAIQLTNTVAATLPLQVFDVTSDPAVVSISEWHTFVQGFAEGTMSISEIMVFDNASDKAFSDSSGRSLKFALPADATNLQFEGPGLGSRFIREGETFFDLDALLPGAHASQISVSYTIPYRKARSMSRTISYPYKSWDVIVPEGEVQVSGLPDRGIQTLPNGGAVHLYVQQTPGPPGTVRYEISGQPRQKTAAGSDRTSLLISMAALAGGLLVAASLVLYARNERTGSASQPTSQVVLVQQAANLDDAFARGDVSESYYRQSREMLLRQLREGWRDV